MKRSRGLCPLVSMLPVSRSLDQERLIPDLAAREKLTVGRRAVWQASACFIHASGDGARQAVCGRRADPGQGHLRVLERRFARRKGENDVAVERGENRENRARHACAAMVASRLHCWWVRAASVATTQSVVLARSGRRKFEGRPRRMPGPWMRGAKAAELGSLLEGSCPEMRGVCDGYGTDRVHRRQCTDSNICAFGGRQAANRSDALPRPPRMSLPSPADTIAPRPAPAEPSAKSFPAQAAAS